MKVQQRKSASEKFAASRQTQRMEIPLFRWPVSVVELPLIGVNIFCQTVWFVLVFLHLYFFSVLFSLILFFIFYVAVAIAAALALKEMSSVLYTLNVYDDCTVLFGTCGSKTFAWMIYYTWVH